MFFLSIFFTARSMQYNAHAPSQSASIISSGIAPGMGFAGGWFGGWTSPLAACAAVAAAINPSPARRAPGVAGAGLGAEANSHLRRQIGHVFLLCSHVVMHMRWK